MRAEFDNYIEKYRENNNKYITLSGEDSKFFAEFRSTKLYEITQRMKRISSTLDFGCGDGLMTSFISKLFTNAKNFGIDPSSKSIEIAKSRNLSINFQNFNGINLDFPDNSIDVIYSANVFHHIQWNLHSTYLKEIFRILSPDGMFVLMEHNPLNPLTMMSFLRNPMDKNAKIMPPWYSKKVIGEFGKTNTEFQFFFPRFLKFLRPLEKYMTKLPIGAMYACYASKP